MTNIKYTDIDIESVLLAGEKKLQEEKDKAEESKRDNLRGGNSGCIDITNGDIYGCHRAAIARSLGLQVATDQHSRLFFDAGEGIEEILRPKFEAGWPHGVKCEEEIPVRWTTAAGHNVTGRPDFVLMDGGVLAMDDEGNKLSETLPSPHVGVELKTIVSYNGMKRVWFDHKPEAKHVIQSAHYMWQHNCPWVLTYVSPARYMASLYDFKKMPREAKMKIHPFRAHFYLEYRDDKLYYKYNGKETGTIITTQGINDYYDLIKECIESKNLAFHPVSKYIDGQDMPYRHESYCAYCKAAEEVNGNWDDWVMLLQGGEK